MVTLRTKGEEVYSKTRDIFFSACADGNSLIISLLTENSNTVIQSFKTRSALMNITFYTGLMYELITTELKTLIPQGKLKEAQNLLESVSHLQPFSTENSVFEVFKSRYAHQRNSSNNKT